VLAEQLSGTPQSLARTHTDHRERDPRRLPLATNPNTSSRVVPLYGRVVKALAGHKSTVRCWSQDDWKRRADEWAMRWPELGPLGPWRAYTVGTPPTVHLSPEICAELAIVVGSARPLWRDPWPDALAWSIQALAHESVHAGGVKGEAKAECYGMQQIQAAAVLLGRSTSEGRYMARRYWRRWYQWLAPPYRSNACRNRGPLDLHRTDVWP